MSANKPFDGLHCRFCGASLTFAQRFRKRQFCTPDHRDAFLKEQEVMALTRLQGSQLPNDPTSTTGLVSVPIEPVPPPPFPPALSLAPLPFPLSVLVPALNLSPLSSLLAAPPPRINSVPLPHNSPLPDILSLSLSPMAARHSGPFPMPPRTALLSLPRMHPGSNSLIRQAPLATEFQALLFSWPRSAGLPLYGVPVVAVPLPAWNQLCFITPPFRSSHAVYRFGGLR